MKAAFEQLGLANVRLDKAGNVLGDRPGVRRGHTLWSPRTSTRCFPRAPTSGSGATGPSCRGRASATTAGGWPSCWRSSARSSAPSVQTDGPVTFVADVGEEGLGDLRGMKQLFGDTMKGQIDRFLAIDGAGLFLVNAAVGSHRYRVTFKGPGGHSYAAFGTANPIQAMGRAIAKISQLQVPGAPNRGRRSTSAGWAAGRRSTPSRPSAGWRSTCGRPTRRRWPRSRPACSAPWMRPCAKRTSGGASARDHVGPGARRRSPAGATPAESPIVQTALAAARALGITLPPAESSTDANIPIQLKIPAITIGAGGRGTGPHTAGETFDTTDAWRGTQYAVLVAIALARR